ncbi:hypothetical protein BC834DRAFT_1031639 [Gloeopeniophorella convolvens]|nr:hypothetical protein BC834DRAFT_1031639 [Gloeopeniophorella convolvens]
MASSRDDISTLAPDSLMDRVTAATAAAAASLADNFTPAFERHIAPNSPYIRALIRIEAEGRAALAQQLGKTVAVGGGILASTSSDRRRCTAPYTQNPGSHGGTPNARCTAYAHLRQRPARKLNILRHWRRTTDAPKAYTCHATQAALVRNAPGKSGAHPEAERCAAEAWADERENERMDRVDEELRRLEGAMRDLEEGTRLLMEQIQALESCGRVGAGFEAVSEAATIGGTNRASNAELFDSRVEKNARGSTRAVHCTLLKVQQAQRKASSTTRCVTSRGPARLRASWTAGMVKAVVTETAIAATGPGGLDLRGPASDGEKTFSFLGSSEDCSARGTRVTTLILSASPQHTRALTSRWTTKQARTGIVARVPGLAETAWARCARDSSGDFTRTQPPLDGGSLPSLHPHPLGINAAHQPTHQPTPILLITDAPRRAVSQRPTPRAAHSSESDLGSSGRASPASPTSSGGHYRGITFDQILPAHLITNAPASPVDDKHPHRSARGSEGDSAAAPPPVKREYPAPAKAPGKSRIKSTARALVRGLSLAKKKPSTKRERERGGYEAVV